LPCAALLPCASGPLVPALFPPRSGARSSLLARQSSGGAPLWRGPCTSSLVPRSSVPGGRACHPPFPLSLAARLRAKRSRVAGRSNPPLPRRRRSFLAPRSRAAGRATPPFPCHSLLGCGRNGLGWPGAATPRFPGVVARSSLVGSGRPGAATPFLPSAPNRSGAAGRANPPFPSFLAARLRANTDPVSAPSSLVPRSGRLGPAHPPLHRPTPFTGGRWLARVRTGAGGSIAGLWSGCRGR
jgi:hypothetical protein